MDDYFFLNLCNRFHKFGDVYFTSLGYWGFTMRNTIRKKIEKILNISKQQFKNHEGKNWDENNGYVQCKTKEGFYHHAQATILMELLYD